MKVIDASRGYANAPKKLLEFLDCILVSRIQVSARIAASQANVLFFYVSSDKIPPIRPRSLPILHLVSFCHSTVHSLGY